MNMIDYSEGYGDCKAELLQKIEELENLYSDECEIPTNGNDPSSNKDFICFQWDKYKDFKEFLDGEKNE